MAKSHFVLWHTGEPPTWPPENTLASIKLAWELGADAAECDVRLSSDNQVVVFHDKNSKKLTGESHVVAEPPWKRCKILPSDPRNEPARI